MDARNSPRANVLGLGLIGGSLCLSLAELGYEVGGDDALDDRVTTALDRGVIARAGLFRDASITFVATPVGSTVESCVRALRETDGVVTDVGSVKARIVSGVEDDRFVGGHPMAGSELDGLDGADASMFTGCVWVLTPSARTTDSTFESVASVVTRMGGEPVALSPEVHDQLVAMVSHVPHLAAATLMRLADIRSRDHAAMLRLAAGGFRDMTRIASGRPNIWLDICDQNRAAIVSGLDGFIEALRTVRGLVVEGDKAGLSEHLESARSARINLPARDLERTRLTECRVPILDRPGSAAEVFSLSANLGVNVLDFEVVHSVEGDRGVMVLVVKSEQAAGFREGLLARGFKPSCSPLA